MFGYVVIKYKNLLNHCNYKDYSRRIVSVLAVAKSMKNNVAVVIPYYHSELTELELISFRNCCTILKKYQIIPYIT